MMISKWNEYTKNFQEIVIAGMNGGLAVNSLFHLFNLPNKISDGIYQATQNTTTAVLTTLTLGGIYAAERSIKYLAASNRPTIAIAAFSTLAIAGIVNAVVTYYKVDVKNSIIESFKKETTQTALTLYGFFSAKNNAIRLFTKKSSHVAMAAGMIGSILGGSLGQERGQDKWGGYIAGALACGICAMIQQQTRVSTLLRGDRIRALINK